MNRQILEIGASIMIRRSDGRTHPAIVASIDHEQNSVKVEWFEAHETKGKEIDFEAAVALNPNLIIPVLDDNSKIVEKVRSTLVNTKVEKRRVSTAPVSKVNTRSQASKNRDTIYSVSDEMVSTSDLRGNGVGVVTDLKYTKSVSDYSATQCSTLKKLNKLEKDRIARRKKQAQIKAEKEVLSKKHVDNPHWELKGMITEYCKEIEIHPLSDEDIIEEHLITVAVRKRPLTRLDISKKEIDIITIPSKNHLIVHEPKLKVDLTKYLDNHVFQFDYTFNEQCSNEVVYKYTAQPLIKTVFEGGFATCFAYGQTGSGKTYTMSGNCHELHVEKGIYGLAAADVFKQVKSREYKHYDFVISCSFFEIYTKKVFDLLNNKKVLRIMEDGKQQVQVVGLTEKAVTSVDEVLELIQKGNVTRASGQTSANMNSSRSHAIFQIYLRARYNLKLIHGKFSLIDLAGNERGADTFCSTKLTRLEGAEINQSLLALKECIRALGRKGSHLPFRASKLTQVLKDSFVGANSKTCMIAMVSPGNSSCENTLNTLRYADRVKELGGGELHISKIADPDVSLKFESGRYNKQKIERIMVTNHKELTQKLFKSAQDAEDLFDLISVNTENYCKSMEELIDDALSSLVYAKECIEECGELNVK